MNLRQSWRLPVMTALAGALLGTGAIAGALAGELPAAVRPAAPAAMSSAASPAGAVQSYAPAVRQVTPSVVLRSAPRTGWVLTSSWTTRATAAGRWLTCPGRRRESLATSGRHSGKVEPDDAGQNQPDRHYFEH